MRVKLRILLYRDRKRLRKSDFAGLRDPLSVGMRYITEFKYLEATKWLLIAPDSRERSLLLGLINLALGQREQALEFLEGLGSKERLTEIEVVVELPGSKDRLIVNGYEELERLLKENFYSLP